MEEDQNMEAFRKKAERRNAEKADVLLELYDLGGFCGRGLPLIDRRSIWRIILTRRSNDIHRRRRCSGDPLQYYRKIV